MRLNFRKALLAAAILPLWIAMFIAADSGYRAWQSIPNAPEEAFSDTGPIFLLLAGWLPSFGVVFLLLRLCQQIFPQRPASPPELPK
jgi:hypothetical protein